jgi:RNA polymerase sigma-70 factor (ECF subfamily)
LFLKNHSYRNQTQTSAPSKTDEEIIHDYRSNHEKYLIGILFDRYVHVVFASCMKYFKDEDDAQDATMEIFESLQEKLLKYEVEFLKSWLYTTTRNHCLMQLRKVKALKRIDNIEKLTELSVENEGDVHLNNESEIEVTVLKQHLAELKEEQRRCVELMYLEGLSYKDIAEKTGFGLKLVKSYIQNGKRNLKQKLEKYYEGQSRT